MRALDPRVKLLLMLALSSLALIYTRLGWLAGTALASLLLTLAMGVEPLLFWRRIRAFAVLLLMVGLAQCLFIRSGPPLLTVGDIVFVTADGLQRGGQAILRFVTILGAAGLLAGEPNRRVVAALAALKLPDTLIFMLNTALRFLPLFREGFSDSVIAIQLRGVDLSAVPVGKKVKLYSYLLLPVVAESMARSEALAVAMEARGFGAYKRRSYYYALKLRPVDWLGLIVVAALALAAAIVYFSY